jgi:hypothetical protein
VVVAVAEAAPRTAVVAAAPVEAAEAVEAVAGRVSLDKS